MNAKIQTLKAEIRADLKSIEDIYRLLHVHATRIEEGEEHMIATAYYLHNLYTAFESIFQRIAAIFENQIEDRTTWHAELLRRMTLDIEGIRPRVISDEMFDALDELRRFRHVFRSAYRVRLDPDRLLLVLKKAWQLEDLYPQEMEHFLQFLDTLQSQT